MSGSMPVVSQSIMNAMVPVGASTLTWAFRTPYFPPVSMASFHASLAACISLGGASSGSTSSMADACFSSTLITCSAFSG